jgi:CRP/FNR family transcriptional regulator
MSTASQPSWLDKFPALKALEEPAWLAALASAQEVNLAPEAVVFRHGDQCRHFLLVLEGSIRVQKISESGKEIVLYRVGSGESCVLSTACLMAGESYPAEAIVESPVKAIAIPFQRFEDALGGSRGFRAFVFTSYGRRVASLIMLIEEVAFGRMDGRLAQCLLNRAGRRREIHATHHELAIELGTAREVVSRLLKEFERHGWVKLYRGRLEILHAGALGHLADHDLV